MKSIFTFLFVFTVTIAAAKHKSISVAKARDAGLISFKIRGTGIYKGECLKISLENNTEDSLLVLMEAGRRLDSKNNDEQDILITREQTYSLAGHQKKEYTVYGFCCQAGKHTPAANSEFTIGRMANPNLVSLSAFCNVNRFTIKETQSAVWCVSDKKPLASIPESGKKLREFVSKLTKEEVPWYEIEYEKSDSNTLISNKIERISGNISYTLPRDDMYYIELRDSKGKLVQNYTNKKYAEKGTYNCWFDLQVSNFPQGSYFIQIYNGNELVCQQEFML